MTDLTNADERNVDQFVDWLDWLEEQPDDTLHPKHRAVRDYFRLIFKHFDCPEGADCGHEAVIERSARALRTDWL